MTGRRLREDCRLDRDGLGLLERAMTRFHLTAQAYDRVRRVARTIADLEAEPLISAPHLAEALQYRPLD